MLGSTFIKRVVIENFKSIATCDVRLGSLTFLVGPNGAGKSNFLDALSFVKDALGHSLDFAIRQRGGMPNLWHAGPIGHEMNIALELNLPSEKPASYSFRIKLSTNGSGPWRWELGEETCSVGENFFQLKNGQVNSSAGPMPAPTRDRLYLVLASGQPAFRELYEALSDMQFYHLQPRSIPDIDDFDPQGRLRQDGSNLASVLLAIRLANNESQQRIEGFLRAVLPTLKKVSVEPVVVEHAHDPASRDNVEQNSERIALVFHQKVGKSIALFRPGQMSEGTLRTLAVLTALYQIDTIQKGRPILTAIEDIEAAVHPAELAVLFDALEEASLTTQVIVTSQSPELLDHEEVRADSILAVSAAEGVTRLGPPDAACRTALDRHHLTAGELLRIGQLAPEQVLPAGAPVSSK